MYDLRRLSAELVDVERFQEAYYALSDRVGELAARNALAEDEADRLSAFNAEILSHNNPAQRVMYLERVRRELAETKLALLATTRDKETALAHGEELVQELKMYKSVALAPATATVADRRPKTTITRVARVPLANHSLNGQVLAGMGRSVSVPGAVHEVGEDEMTLDEIM
jgi:hypothetical protein